MKTIFCDIDGTLLKHYNKGMMGQVSNESIICNNVRDAILSWDKKSYTIILVTGRKESHRPELERQLKKAGIFWDHLIMGLSNGPRVIVNDIKSADTQRAMSFNVVRNTGISELRDL